MLKVGITGGIGSGKTTVCRVFETLGIPVFYADDAAKLIMEQDAVLVGNIKQLLGADVYHEGKILREKIASIVFHQPALLESLNKLVHPATIKYGEEWMQQQQTSYIIKEAAIFFESDSYQQMDIMIGVYAPLSLRISRAMSRDSISREKVQERINRQMNEDEKMRRCNFIIMNDDEVPVIPQVMQLHGQLLAMPAQHR